MSKTQAYLAENVELQPTERRRPDPLDTLRKISDFYLYYPFASLQEAATALGYKPRFISSIKNSDAFQKFHLPRLEDKQNALQRPVLQLKERLAGVIETTIEKLEARLDCEDADFDPMTVGEYLDIIDKGMKRLGYGEKSTAGTPAVTNIVNFAVADRALLEEARARMKEQFGKPSPQAALAAAGREAKLPDLADITDLTPIEPPRAADGST